MKDLVLATVVSGVAMFCTVGASGACEDLNRVIPCPDEIVRREGTCPAGACVREVEKPSLVEEAYEIVVAPEGITFFASGRKGFFYARQTLEQLKFGCDRIPCLTIRDSPRFSWRALHLDVSRHFFTAEEVKRFIDQMSRFKLNIFQWHLVDSHGWRLEIPKYPELTRRGAWRYDGDMDRNGKPYGGYYTTDEVRDVVRYAEERCVTVVPVIEIPGHENALTLSYPFLACDEKMAAEAELGSGFRWNPTRNYKRYVSVHPTIYDPGQKKAPSTLCVGRESTFAFLRDVLDEVMRLFPSPYIHIGGDEVETKYWEKCDRCRARAKEVADGDVSALMPYTATRVARYLRTHGRMAVGFDDILDGGMPEEVVVQSWRSEAGAVKAARKGVRCIMSPIKYLYFCCSQSDGYYEPDAYPGFLPLQLVYSYDPIPKAVRRMGREDLVIGIEACHWSEYINDAFQLDVQAWPRALAVAELAWCRAEKKDPAAFEHRVECAKKVLDAMGVDYWDETKDYHGWDLYDNDPLPTLKKPPRPDTTCEAYMKAARKLYPRLAYADYASNIVVQCVARQPAFDGTSLETGLGWRKAPGLVNVRDIGGWNGLRTGKVFRAGLSEPDAEAGLKALGAKTGVDVRKVETRLWAGADAASLRRREHLRKALLPFVQKENYPICLYSRKGADRAGLLAVILEGLCGVRETDLAIDYELTSFSDGREVRTRSDREDAVRGIFGFKAVIDLVKTYPGFDLQEQFAEMVKDCFGLSDEEIGVIRSQLEK